MEGSNLTGAVQLAAMCAKEAAKKGSTGNRGAIEGTVRKEETERRGENRRENKKERRLRLQKRRKKKADTLKRSTRNLDAAANDQRIKDLL